MVVRVVASSPMPMQALLIDWAGTVTVPMSQMMLPATQRAGLDDKSIAALFASFSNYVSDHDSKNDSPFHRAERGEMDDEDLVDYFNEIAPGSGAIFDANSPASFIHSPDRPEMILLLEDLRSADVTVFLATNNFQSFQDSLASRYLDNGLVSAIVNSALVGTRKPEDAFFELCLDAAGCDGTEAMLLDDQQRNLDAAATFGMETVLVEDDCDPAITIVREAFGL